MTCITAMQVQVYIQKKEMPDANLVALLLISYQLKTTIILGGKILSAIQECAVRLLHMESTSHKV